MYYPPYRPRRPGWRAALDQFAHTLTQRSLILGVVGFCLCVFVAYWYIQSNQRPFLSNFPPSQSKTYHVTSTGVIVPPAVGGGAISLLTPVPQHAALLDHQYHITAEFGHYPNGGPHYGLDLDAWRGTIVHAPVNGKVTEVLRGCVEGDTGCGKGWGNHVWFQSV